MAEIFDISDGGKHLNEGAWFDYGDGGKICVRTCSADDLEEISKQCEKTKVEYKLNEKTRQMERIPFEDVDKIKQRRLYWDYIICDWKNLVDKNGNDILCTTENKAMLMGKSTKFATFILKCLEILVGDEKKAEEEEQKN